MTRYLLARLAASLLLIVAVVVVNFLLVHSVPGDPVQALVGDYPVPPAYLQEVRATFGLDRPLSEQLWRYLVTLAHGNFGYSFANRQPVLSLILGRAGYTLAVMLPALVSASVLGVVVGMTAAYRVRTAYDSLVTSASLVGYSLPVFWLGQLLILLFAVQLGWLPAQGTASLREPLTGPAAVLDFLRHWILPYVSVTVFYLAGNARVARSSMLDVISQDYVTTARAKGLPDRRVRWRHVLPNALIPILTVAAYDFGYALTGAILTETVFGWPGVGNLFYVSIANRDYPVLEGIFIVTGISVVAVNFVTDVLYTRVDPHLRLGGAVHA